MLEYVRVRNSSNFNDIHSLFGFSFPEVMTNSKNPKLLESVADSQKCQMHLNPALHRVSTQKLPIKGISVKLISKFVVYLLFSCCPRTAERALPLTFQAIFANVRYFRKPSNAITSVFIGCNWSTNIGLYLLLSYRTMLNTSEIKIRSQAKFIIGICFRYPMKIKDNIVKNI